MLSSVFTELPAGRLTPVKAAEECALFLSGEAADLFPGIGGENLSTPGISFLYGLKEQILAAAFAQASGPAPASAVKQPLFLLFHAFLFYDSL